MASPGERLYCESCRTRHEQRERCDPLPLGGWPDGLEAGLPENVHGADACAWGGKCGCERRAALREDGRPDFFKIATEDYDELIRYAKKGGYRNEGCGCGEDHRKPVLDTRGHPIVPRDGIPPTDDEVIPCPGDYE